MPDQQNSMAGKGENRAGVTPGWLLPTSALRDHAYCARMAWFRWSEGCGLGRRGGTSASATDPQGGDSRAAENADDEAPSTGRAYDWDQRPVCVTPQLSDRLPMATYSSLSSDEIGIEALVQHIPDPSSGGRVVLVDRGGASPGGGRAWKGDMVEAAAQAMLLRACGSGCDRAMRSQTCALRLR